jgi:hypothetical protein
VGNGADSVVIAGALAWTYPYQVNWDNEFLKQLGQADSQPDAIAFHLYEGCCRETHRYQGDGLWYSPYQAIDHFADHAEWMMGSGWDEGKIVITEFGDCNWGHPEAACRTPRPGTMNILLGDIAKRGIPVAVAFQQGTAIPFGIDGLWPNATFELIATPTEWWVAIATENAAQYATQTPLPPDWATATYCPMCHFQDANPTPDGTVDYIEVRPFDITPYPQCFMYPWSATATCTVVPTANS